MSATIIRFQSEALDKVLTLADDPRSGSEVLAPQGTWKPVGDDEPGRPVMRKAVSAGFVWKRPASY